jgi:hypothetical protein
MIDLNQLLIALKMQDSSRESHKKLIYNSEVRRAIGTSTNVTSTHKLLLQLISEEGDFEVDESRDDDSTRSIYTKCHDRSHERDILFGKDYSRDGPCSGVTYSDDQDAEFVNGFIDRE